jgi:hypothetical protein
MDKQNRINSDRFMTASKTNNYAISLKNKIFDTRAKLTVPEAKDAVGLSRKYILPLLNRIERDGLIKRLGDFRIKA